MTWILLTLRRYVDFRGRSRRREYWTFVLFVVGVLICAGAAMIVANGSFRTQREFTTSYATWAGLALTPLIVPLIAVTIRRLHDVGLSGWWLLVLPLAAMIPALDALVPFAHALVMALPGKQTPNRFGGNPKSERST